MSSAFVSFVLVAPLPHSHTDLQSACCSQVAAVTLCWRRVSHPSRISSPATPVRRIRAGRGAHEVTLVQGGHVAQLLRRMAGPIVSTQAIGGFLLFGRGLRPGNASLPPPGTPAHRAESRWDLIVRINPDGTGLVNNQVAGVVTPLNLADISTYGNQLTANVPRVCCCRSDAASRRVDVQPLACSNRHRRWAERPRISTLAHLDDCFQFATARRPRASIAGRLLGIGCPRA